MVLYETIGQLLTNIGLFGGGITAGILGILFGTARGMTKNEDEWAIIFSALAWTIALITPNTIWAGSIFIAGAIGITLTIQPLMKKINGSNIFVIGVIAAIMNVSILIGAGAFQESINWGTNIEETRIGVQRTLGTEINALNQETPSHGLCTPSQERAGTCKNSVLGGTFNPLIFDVFASIITIGDYIGKAIKLGGMAVFAPMVIAFQIKEIITNDFVGYLIGLYITIWNLAILYNIIKFALNKRGINA